MDLVLREEEREFRGLYGDDILEAYKDAFEDDFLILNANMLYISS